MDIDFSAQPLRSPCLRFNFFSRYVHRRGAETAEVAQRKLSVNSLSIIDVIENSWRERAC